MILQAKYHQTNTLKNHKTPLKHTKPLNKTHSIFNTFKIQSLCINHTQNHTTKQTHIIKSQIDRKKSIKDHKIR